MAIHRNHDDVAAEKESNLSERRVGLLGMVADVTGLVYRSVGASPCSHFSKGLEAPLHAEVQREGVTDVRHMGRPKCLFPQALGHVDLVQVLGVPDPHHPPG